MNREDRDKSHSTGALFRGSVNDEQQTGTSDRAKGASVKSISSTIDLDAFTRLPPKSRKHQSRESQVKTIGSADGAIMSYNSSVSTSDVSSEGDAASIVSRLSQIVVEEVCKLQEKFGVQQQPETINFGDGIESKPFTPVNYKFVKVDAWNDQAVKQGSQLDGFEIIPRINIQTTPESIQNDQIGSANDNQQHSKQGKSTRRESTDSRPAIGMRRNESSGFLPERGDLRRLESLRNKQQQENFRNRSNTTSNLDRSSIVAEPNSELVLNIKRSAWKLSDFDKTFEANQSDETVEHSAPIFKLGGNNLELVENIPPPDKSASSGTSKLLRSFRKKVASPQQHPAGIQRDDSSSTGFAKPMVADIRRPTGGDIEVVNKSPIENYLTVNKVHNNNNNNNSRRPSNAHSINSITTSIDSFYSGLNKRINKSAMGKRRKRLGGEKESINLEESCCRTCFSLDTFSQYLPILDWLPKYKSSYFTSDLTGAIVLLIMNISSCISAAVVAETDLSVAFRCSIINTFIYSIFCSSRHTSFGSWSLMSQMSLVGVERALNDEYILDRLNLDSSLSKEDYDRLHYQLIIMFTFLIGLVQLICGLLNLGSILSSFIPEALCSSFIAGTAITMSFAQLANMMGTTNKILIATEKNLTQVYFNHLKEPQADITDLLAGLFGWIKKFGFLVKHYHLINPACAIISIVSLTFLFLNQYVIQRQLESLLKKKILIPFEMILVVILIPVTYYFELKSLYQVPTCGPIQSSLVMPNIPDLRLIRELWDQSLAAALISYTITYIMGKCYSNKLNYEVDFNQELIACGAGNLVGGLFDALPATSSFIRTAGNVEAGAKTQMSNVISCLLLVGVTQIGGSSAEYLPVCLMSTCLFFGFLRLTSRISDIVKYWRICKVDFAIWMVTFLAILASDIVNGFVFGFIFTIFTMLYRAQNRRCYMLGTIDNLEVYVPLVKYPLAREIVGIKIFQFCGPIHYVCADLFEQLLRQKTKVDVNYVLDKMNKHKQLTGQFKYINNGDSSLPNHIILDFSMISFIDTAGINIIKKIIEDYQQIGVTILVASLASHVAAVIKCDPSLWNTYKDRFYVSLADAVHCAIRDNERKQHPFAIVEGMTGTMQPPAIIKMIEE